MAGKQAKILTDQQIESLLAFASFTRKPDRNKVIVLLSIKAGLRAAEIANLTLEMVVRPTGVVGSILELPDRAAKTKRVRRIPLHPDLRAALNALHKKSSTTTDPVAVSERGGQMTSVSIINWLAEAFRTAGLNGCSSHSQLPRRPIDRAPAPCIIYRLIDRRSRIAFYNKCWWAVLFGRRSCPAGQQEAGALDNQSNIFAKAIL